MSLRSVATPFPRRFERASPNIRPIAYSSAETAEMAEQRLAEFEAEWGKKYPAIGLAWRRASNEVIPFFAYPPEVRRMIYITDVLDKRFFGSAVFLTVGCRDRWRARAHASGAQRRAVLRMELGGGMRYPSVARATARPRAGKRMGSPPRAFIVAPRLRRPRTPAASGRDASSSAACARLRQSEHRLSLAGLAGDPAADARVEMPVPANRAPHAGNGEANDGESLVIHQHRAGRRHFGFALTAGRWRQHVRRAARAFVPCYGVGHYWNVGGHTQYV